VIASQPMPTFSQTALRPVVERQTYLNLAYLLLSFPLGLCCFVVVVTLFALGFGLAVTVVGLPVLALALLTARRMADLTGEFAHHLLGVAQPPQPETKRRLGVWGALRRELADRRSWRDAAFLLLLFPVGIINLTAVVSLLGASVWMLEQPVLVLAGWYTPMGDGWLVDSLPDALLFPIPGLLLALGSLHLLNGLAEASKGLARALVGPRSYRTLRLPAARTLAHDRELTGAEVLRELRLCGCGDAAPSSVYAALRSLEDIGLVTGADRDGERRYALSALGASRLTAA
jgi:hypothetical protein